MDGLLTREQALEQVLARAERLGTESVPVSDSAGRVLTSAALAGVDLPSFPASAMDGYAVRAADTPGRLPIVGRIAAGRPSVVSLESGAAMAIATGGVVPEGADAVVPIEDAEVDGDAVTIANAVASGLNVRLRGGDLSAGQPVVAAGTRLGAVHLGALSAAGLVSVECARTPRVVLAVTGSELRSPGDALARGEIYDANGLILETQLRSAGAHVERLPIVRDDPGSTRTAIERGLQADVLVTSGGVSVGAYDYVRQCEQELGVEEVFWRVAVRPGKPVAFGVRGKTLVFGLPGNPVSSLVGFELFVRPALLALQGLTEPRPPYRPGVLTASVACLESRESLVRARIRATSTEVQLEPLVGQDSHMIAAAATADALVLIRAGAGRIEAGSLVSYLVL